MTPTFKKIGLPLLILIGGTAILGWVWWINGAEREDLWFYSIAIFFVLYAAYEVYAGLNKHKNR